MAFMAKSVLVVDAPGPEREALLKGLDGLGCRASAASGLDEARRLAGGSRPDLVIVNILLAGTNGLELLDALRALPEAKGAPFLVLSLTDRAALGTGPNSLIADYLVKPVELEKLLSALQKAGAQRVKRVLVADDDADLSELLTIFLRTRGIEVREVHAGHEVSAAAEKFKPDVLLLDLMLPGKTGFEVLRELKSYPATESIPVVVMSAMHLNAYQERGLLTGEPEIIGSDVPRDFVFEVIKKLLSATPADKPKAPAILVADDEPAILAILKDILEREGFEVRTASDGEEALASIRRSAPDIAVLDYQMPRKNGIQVTAELKRDPALEYLPVILLSGAAERDTRVSGLNLGADDFIAKPVDLPEFLARIRMIIKRTQGVLAANPLTRLPGNVSIETRINEALKSGAPLDVLYLDLNHFKAYNDAYGFQAGDRVIKATGELLLSVVRASPKDFVGHIGGDDFIVVTQPDRSEALAQRMLEAFAHLAPTFYGETDRKRGYILSTDRQGNVKQFPLLSLSIGIVTNRHRKLASLGQVSQIGAEVKKKAKSLGGNRCYVDRRKD